MVLKRILFPAFLMVLATSCTSGKSDRLEELQEEEPTVDPKALYVMHCASCHGMDGKQGTSNAADLSKSTLSDQESGKMIRFGNDKGMMPYKDILSATEIDSLTAFIKTLRN